MNSERLNIVIPMAGRGERFSKAGYELPKPLIPVHGRAMIDVVVENLRPLASHRFIFLCLSEHLKKFNLATRLNAICEDPRIIPIDEITQGAACTVLMAKEFINNHQPLMIANCDQYISTPIDTYLQEMEKNDYDGYIMSMTASDKKWSYIQFDENNAVKALKEKEVVSSEATVGIYNFRHGCDFVNSASEMIAKNDRVNGEFYVAPVYNYLIERRGRIGFFNIGAERAGMYGLGIPDDLEYFKSIYCAGKLFAPTSS